MTNSKSVVQALTGKHAPVMIYSLTQTLGFPVSPLNLMDIPFDTPSYNGSNSGFFALTEQLQGHPQLQFTEV